MTRRSLLLGLLALASCAREVVLVDASTYVKAPLETQAPSDPVLAHVRCEAPESKGAPIGCTVSHDGARSFELCWEGEFRCKNAVVMRVRSCNDAPPSVEVRQLLGAKELAGWDRCDAVDEARVANAWIVDR